MKTGVLLTLMLGAGVAYAQQPMGSDTDHKAATTTKSSSSKTVHISAEVVATDADAKTITVRPAEGTAATGTSGTTGMAGTSSAPATGETRTLMVDTKAAASLKSVKFGDKVTLTCSASDANSTSGSSGYGTAGTSGTTGASGTSTTGTSASSSMDSTTSGDFAHNCATVTSISKTRATTPDNK